MPYPIQPTYVRVRDMRAGTTKIFLCPLPSEVAHRRMREAAEAQRAWKPTHHIPEGTVAPWEVEQEPFDDDAFARYLQRSAEGRV